MKTVNENKLYDRAIKDLSGSNISAGKAAIKDLKTYRKYGLLVERDDLNRVTGISGEITSKKQIRKIGKMQRKLSRNGTKY